MGKNTKTSWTLEMQSEVLCKDGHMLFPHQLVPSWLALEASLQRKLSLSPVTLYLWQSWFYFEDLTAWKVENRMSKKGIAVNNEYMALTVVDSWAGFLGLPSYSMIIMPKMLHCNEGGFEWWEQKEKDNIRNRKNRDI